MRRSVTHCFMELALFQPDQPQNTGTILRLGACMGVRVHIIEPCGFPFSLKAFKRAAMDYADQVDVIRHETFEAFWQWAADHKKSIILLTTKSAVPHTHLSYETDNILLLGQESAGVPEEIHKRIEKRVVIPMKPGMRSLNIAVAASMVLAEALRQTNQFFTTAIKE